MFSSNPLNKFITVNDEAVDVFVVVVD